QTTTKLFLFLLQYRPQLLGTFERLAVRQHAGGVDGRFAVQRPPGADGVVIFKAKAQGVHALMAGSATRIGPVLLHALPQSSGQFFALLQLRDIGRRWRRRGAEQILQYPLASFHRRRARRIRSHRENAGLSQNSAALIAGQMNSLKLVALYAGGAVMPRQPLV